MLGAAKWGYRWVWVLGFEPVSLKEQQVPLSLSHLSISVELNILNLILIFTNDFLGGHGFPNLVLSLFCSKL